MASNSQAWVLKSPRAPLSSRAGSGLRCALRSTAPAKWPRAALAHGDAIRGAGRDHEAAGVGAAHPRGRKEWPRRGTLTVAR
jgi:hypothetical protein